MKIQEIAWGQIALSGGTIAAAVTTNTTTSTTLIIAKPSGLAVGNIMIAQVVQSGNNTTNSIGDASSTDGSWSPITGSNIRGDWFNYSHATLLYKIATSSDVEATDFSFTLDGNADDGEGGIIGFSGVQNTDPFDVTPGTAYTNVGSDAQLNASAITTATANSVVLMFGAMHDNITASAWSSGRTELYDVDFNATVDIGMAAAYATQTAAGNTGAGTASLSGTANNGAILIALKRAVPTLTVNPTSLNFGYVAYPGTSGEQMFELSGTTLSAGPITITAPTGFQVSLTSGSGFASSVTVPYTVPTLDNTNIYIRFSPSAANTTYSNNVTNAGGGATTVNVAVTGTSAIPAGVCSFNNNTSEPLTVIPCINMPSNVMQVSTNIDTRDYFVMNVIKGLTYQVYTTENPNTSLKLTVYNESSQAFVAYSESNTGNPTSTDADDVYLSFTSPVSGQFRVLINSRASCTSTTFTNINTNVNVTGGSNTQDSQTTAGTNTWIGHIYDGTNAGILYNGSFVNYLGYYTQIETFNQTFGGSAGDNTCFSPVSSDNATRATVIDASFSVRYRMTSNKKGLYTAEIGSDDGSRLTVDGTLVYNDWIDQGYAANPRVLINLTGNSNLLLDFYEGGADNRLSFQTLALVLENTLSANTTQNICLGNPGSAISGDTYGTLPTGITLSGTGYQWMWSTSLSGPWTDISGATAATFTPNSANAPFNSPNTYYVIRKAKLLSAANNIGIPNYIATNESNAATLTVNALPTFTYTQTNISCSGLTDGKIQITASGGNGNYTYSILNGDNFPYSGPSPKSIENLAPDTYTIQVKDSNNCIQTICQ